MLFWAVKCSFSSTALIIMASIYSTYSLLGRILTVLLTVSPLNLPENLMNYVLLSSSSHKFKKKVKHRRLSKSTRKTDSLRNKFWI